MKENSSNKMLPENVLTRRQRNCSQAAIAYPAKDGQIAQYKCVDLDRHYSAHRVYLNYRTARDRFIVINSFFYYFIILFSTRVTFALRDLC